LRASRLPTNVSFSLLLLLLLLRKPSAERPVHECRRNSRWIPWLDRLYIYSWAGVTVEEPSCRGRPKDAYNYWYTGRREEGREGGGEGRRGLEGSFEVLNIAPLRCWPLLESKTWDALVSVKGLLQEFAIGVYHPRAWRPFHDWWFISTGRGDHSHKALWLCVCLKCFLRATVALQHRGTRDPGLF